MARPIDDDFRALPLQLLADAALSRARDLGVSHADVRVERIRTAALRLHDARPETSYDEEERGLCVRVIHDGTWGFAGGAVLTADAAAALADEAVAIAKASRPVNTEPVELASEPTYADVTWVSDYDIDPFDVPEADRVGLLQDWSRRLLDHGSVHHADATLRQVKENKFYADSSGTSTTQQRVRVLCELEAAWVDAESGRFESMRTLAPPVGRGWEFLTRRDLYDWDEELTEIPMLLAEKAAAPSVDAGSYDLVIHPSNLFLTIHESIGHATELDRALGYEANYAGTSFATPDQLGSLVYGSPVMHVTGDRQAQHGLATIGWDDEGVAAQTWDIIKDGTLVGYQLDRRIARHTGQTRSNGCAFADSPLHVPIQRMANVSLQPAADGPSTDELISGVDNGIYIVGDKSWSIDMQRYNFQFTGQRFYRIRNGKLGGMLRDVAYQATTTDFWRSMEAVGGPDTY
ncbi:MAG TPA: TldD/PmbA family protein, partial [Mycobacteriales bacterium]|nr:TldD/PmbA family protein [Mycobacteriales bacterium]